MDTVAAKICGLNDPVSLKSALDAGAEYIGVVFFPPSPRSLMPAEAKELFGDYRGSAKLVGLFVDPDDELIRSALEAVPLDILQLHGNETPERVQEIRVKFGKPVMKAVKIATRDDLLQAKAYESVSDMLLFDAKAPKSMKDALPGGNGLSFDWTMLADLDTTCPWMLAGGLTADNVTDAVRISRAKAVDTSSGVETEPGRKDPTEVVRFLEVVHGINLES
ncbi:phosphoribosylanthranilate isomerase [Sneathiella limimaris]|uniref:phosphoribosylanthranilate isomerase n=1 Tax=Sneathiella limimaris TaxID=1964213 RepID=UPI00146B461C|nr:phosphoribosylanthranilate isomerase [Sneathiella limimaris]